VSCVAWGGAGGGDVVVWAVEGEGMIVVSPAGLVKIHEEMGLHEFVPVVMFVTPTPETRTWRSFGCGRCACGVVKMRGKR